MVENVPLIVKAFNRTVIVPGIGVATKVINNNAFVLKTCHRIVGNGIAEAGCLSTMTVCVTEKIIILSVNLFN